MIMQECNGEIFAFLLNESELRNGAGGRTTTTNIEEHESNGDIID
jgi:hypothetical protein